MKTRVLDITKHGDKAQELISRFNSLIVGQEKATEALVNILEFQQSGLNPVGRPIGNALFLGPTGSGKTRVVEVMAESLFGNDRAMLKVDCAEFQHSHEIAKLVGSPPGYLGHRETHAFFSQVAIDKFVEKAGFCIVLFDEIEKSSDSLWSLLLGILDKATLKLGTNETVSFEKCIIVMTSNLGAGRMAEETDGGLGFVTRQEDDTEALGERMESIGTEAMRKKFTPEFINRIENIVTFKTLTEGQMREILDIEIQRLQIRLLGHAATVFHFVLSGDAKDRLLKEGYSKKFGVRNLRRTLEKKVQIPLARLVSSGQINFGDGITIREVGKEDFEFSLQPGILNMRLT